jgi:two-component system OmpR family response regulator
MREPGIVLSRFALLERAWERDQENRSNVVDQHVRALRDRVDRPFGVESIETVRGSGYRLRRDGGA